MLDEREKVRVTFFQQSKPLEVDLPDDPPFCDQQFIMSSPVLKNDVNHIVYNRTESRRSRASREAIKERDLSTKSKQTNKRGERRTNEGPPSGHGRRQWGDSSPDLRASDMHDVEAPTRNRAAPSPLRRPPSRSTRLKADGFRI
ncbi:hypothetical protein GWI33_022988 [Rhynchophorus ferrugineus]|uniref:Uncharacterized protein n=1 Tax=Rhynchophorus ferrugineus TaxID=354439 RepID=A0A834ITQ5_RHYFE|nr:hypothetical protein GWI33_022988 [Rhynchophorus ferrugineus]